MSIRDFFEPGGAHRMVSLFEKYSSINEEDSDLLLSALALSRTVMRTEDNKSKSLLLSASLKIVSNNTVLKSY